MVPSAHSRVVVGMLPSAQVGLLDMGLVRSPALQTLLEGLAGGLASTLGGEGGLRCSVWGQGLEAFATAKLTSPPVLQ